MHAGRRDSWSWFNSCKEPFYIELHKSHGVDINMIFVPKGMYACWWLRRVHTLHVDDCAYTHKGNLTLLSHMFVSGLLCKPHHTARAPTDTHSHLHMKTSAWVCVSPLSAHTLWIMFWIFAWFNACIHTCTCAYIHRLVNASSTQRHGHIGLVQDTLWGMRNSSGIRCPRLLALKHVETYTYGLLEKHV